MTESGYRVVVLSSGHMIDGPDRPLPRFPAWLEPVVADEIERVFDSWDIGSADLVLTSGARGSDILAAESGHRRGSDIEIILPSPPQRFEETSVALPRSIWPQRFRYLLSQHRNWVSESAHDDGEPGHFAGVNRALIRRAQELAAPADFRVALVWDERPPDGPGGTADFAKLAMKLNAPLAIINPVRLMDALRP